MESAKNSQVICVVDDDEMYNKAICLALQEDGYTVIPFASASSFLEHQAANSVSYDLILTDINMPGHSGYDLCKSIRANSAGERVPIVMVTGSDAKNEKAEGLNAGADDFIQKPFNRIELLAKIRSLLGIRAQSIERIGRISRFLSPNVADLVLSGSQQQVLKPHRAHVTVMFIDLRGFTAFSEAVEPEEVLQVLNEYYLVVGNASLKYKVTLGLLAGDGVMLFLNDPVPIANHQELAVHLALEIRNDLAPHKALWQQRNYGIDFGIGIAEGHATIGQIGFDHFSQYTVIGPVANFAARLCNAAVDGQILVSNRYIERIDASRFDVEPVRELSIKGLSKPVSTNNILNLKTE